VQRPALTLLILCFVTIFLGLGRQAITDSDEGYYAEASREMVESGDWLTPRFNYENRFEKPVLYYWLTAATYLVTGPDEAAARFWAAMSGVGLVLLTWRIAGGRARQDASWLAAAIVATSFGSVSLARWALPDLPLALFITLTIWASMRATQRTSTEVQLPMFRWLVAGMAAGLGFLTKGPVALVIPAVVLVPIWWRTRRSVRVDVRGFALAVAVFAIVGLPWYVLMWREHGAEYLRGFFVGDNVERFATSRFNDARPVWYYGPVLLGGLLPWSIALATFIWRPLIDLARRKAVLRSAQWDLILWAIMPLLFYTLSVGKQPRYILPMLPPVAVLLAQALIDRITASRARPEHPQRALHVATWLTAVFFVVLAFLLIRLEPLFINTYPMLTWTAAVISVSSGLAFATIALTKRWSRLTVIGPVAAAAFVLAVQFGALSSRRPEAVEQMAALVRANRSANEPVCIYNVFVRNLTFYTRTKLVQAFDVDQAAQLARSPGRVLLVATADDVKAIEMALGAPLRRLGQVQYVNSANLRLRTIVGRGSDDEVTVVLAANH
jgi:4-amino-4-deoxy-L-arabinose transferase-like glycosyltransferase